MSPTGNLRGDYKREYTEKKSLPGNLSGQVFASNTETAGNLPNISTHEPEKSRNAKLTWHQKNPVRSGNTGVLLENIIRTRG